MGNIHVKLHVPVVQEEMSFKDKFWLPFVQQTGTICAFFLRRHHDGQFYEIILNLD